MLEFLQHKSDILAVRPDTLFTVGAFEITNTIFTGIVITILFFFFGRTLKNSLRLIPGKVQNVMEMAVEGMWLLIEQITNDREEAAKLLPLIGTIFVYFMVANLITLIPGMSSFSYDGVSVFRGPTNDFNLTFSVAFAIVLWTQYMSFKAFGFFGHLGKYFKFKELIEGFKKGVGAGMIAFIDFLIGLLDIVSEFAKIFSLSLRLFGNMYAGEILLSLLFGAFALILPSIWIGMNLLVGVIQAIVFGALSAAYYSMAVQVAEAQETN